MNQTKIFAPFVGMMLLTLVVWFYMYGRRLPFIIRSKLSPEQLTPLEFARLSPAQVANPSDNLKNLFELPTLFYAVVLYLYVTQNVDWSYLMAALGIFWISGASQHRALHLQSRAAAFLAVRDIRAGAMVYDSAHYVDGIVLKGLRVKKIGLIASCVIGLICAAGTAGAQANPDWLTPLKPFRIAENLYYVGSRDLASYLIVTPQGDILINSSFVDSVPLIRASVEQLGFHFKDIKILLISHSHSDHDGGSADIIKQTGAKYMVMDGDVPVVEGGGAADFAYPEQHYPVAKVSRVLHDGDEVRLGDAVLIAHKTPGHTRGCTTWTLKVKQDGHLLNAVIVGSWNVNPGFRLIDKPGVPASYPHMADDYRHTFAVLKGLPCDIFLGAHGMYFDLLGKLERIKAGATDAVWIDPEGYRNAVSEREAAFETELKRQEN